ncbi:serine O-acetyltransferase [Flavobacterium frigidarium]|uniref:Serine O-acetyltransferase n=1 Tax=Flavobacterium frigidarium TaxID=99286 RepID=A0ABV4KC69_9FLAO
MKCIRLMDFLYVRGIPILPKAIQWFIRVICSADIPVGIKIGKNSVLKHNGLGVVIHENALIGENVIIMQHVTLGGRNGRGAPVIKNNVFIGAGASVLGDITVGESAMVGAHAVVIKDVPKGVTVGGVPAKILKKIE